MAEMGIDQPTMAHSLCEPCQCYHEGRNDCPKYISCRLLLDYFCVAPWPIGLEAARSILDGARWAPEELMRCRPWMSDWVERQYRHNP